MQHHWLPTRKLYPTVAISLALIQSLCCPVFSQQSRDELGTALFLIKENRLPEAIKVYDVLIAKNPNQGIYYSMRGTANMQLKQYDSALKDFTKAIELKPSSVASAYCLRGMCYAEMKRWQEALNDLSEDIKLRPDHENSYLVRARIYASMGKHDLAKVDFERARSHYSQEPPAKQSSNQNLSQATTYFDQGKKYENTGQLDKARTAIDNCLKLYPESKNARHRRIRINLKLKHFQEAIAEANQLLAINPKDTVALAFRGAAKFNLDDSIGAIDDYNKVLAIDPKNVGALSFRAISLTALNKNDAAMADLNQLLILDPKRADNLFLRAILFGRQRKYDLAKKDLDACLALVPNHPLALPRRALLLCMQHKYTEAEPDLKTSLDMNLDEPNRQLLQIKYAIALATKRNFAEAIALTDKVLKVNPKSAEAWNVRAAAQGELQQNDQALFSMNKALELEKTDMAYANRATLYMELGNFAKAKSDIEEAIKLDPKNSHYWLTKSMLEANLNNNKAALADANKALELDPKNEKLYLYRAAREYDNGEYTLALADCEKFPELLKNNGLNLLLKAQIEAKLSKKSAAISDLEEAVKHLPPDSIREHNNSMHLAEELGRNDIANFELKKLATLPVSSDTDLLFVRGLAKFRLNDGDAAKDLETFSLSNPPEFGHKPFAGILAYFSFIRSGKTEEAEKLLQQLSEKVPATEWPSSIISYLRKELTQEKLIEKAVNNDKKTEAYTYLAFDKELQGKTSEAKNLFEWVIKNGNQSYLEYGLCKDAINRVPEALSSKSKQPDPPLDSNWKQPYVNDIEKRLSRHLDFETIDHPIEVIARFNLHHGGEVSGIEIKGKDRELESSVQSKFKRLIQQAAPYKILNNVSQIAVTVNFKGSEIHAALE